MVPRETPLSVKIQCSAKGIGKQPVYSRHLPTPCLRCKRPGDGLAAVGLQAGGELEEVVTHTIGDEGGGVLEEVERLVEDEAFRCCCKSIICNMYSSDF